MSETTADKPAEAAPPFQKSTLRDYFESICIAFIFALFVRTFVVQAFKIPSSSMEDNLLVGDHILVNKFAYGPHEDWMESVLPYRTVGHEDVFVFKYPKDPSRDFIKRVVGVGGDRIEVRGLKVFRNEDELEEPYVFIKGYPGPRDLQFRDELKVPDRHYYAMGDNRLNSDDSRYWGTVPGTLVKGRALLIYWSFDLPDDLKKLEVKSDPTAADKGRVLRFVGTNFLSRTRWGRTFKLVQ